MSLEGPSANPAGTAPPLLRDRYEVGERLAEGTFFFTHRGRDTESGRAVAIKVLKPEFAADEPFVTRLLSEAQSATSLQHPNIAQTFDAWRERGTVVIITDWVRGINLKDRIRRVAPFPLAVAMDILLACSQALNYAHESGFIHGDIRPDNVIITPDGQVKLTDFGLGASVGASSRIQLNALPRAAYYMGPELAEGRVVDTRTDIYSLGCILYEMLAGTVPYDAETPLAVAVKHLHNPVPSLQKLNAAVPNAVDGIAAKCMQKDPMARYITLQSLLQDIHTVRDALRNDKPLDWSPMKAKVESAPVAPKPKRRPQPQAPAPEKPAAARPAPVHSDGGPSYQLLGAIALLAVLMIGVFYGIVSAMLSAPTQVNVPRNLYRMGQEEAVKRVAALGLRPEVQQEYHPSAPVGTVFRLEPSGGTEIKAGKPVTLWVSKGPEPAKVPSVTGKARDEAENEIRAAGLAVGSTREEFSTDVDKGYVVSQNPPAGGGVPKGSAVTLVISKGEEPIPDPPTTDVDVPTVDNPPVEPDEDDPPTTTPNPDLPEKKSRIEFRIPAESTGAQQVRIIARNEDGTETTAHEGEYQPGDQVNEEVTTYGDPAKSQIRVYLNGQVIDRRTPPR